MSTASKHWNERYAGTETTQLTWHQDEPSQSLDYIRRLAPDATSVVDVGAGTSRLLERLAQTGFQDLSAVDISKQAFEEAGRDPRQVQSIVGDVRTWRPSYSRDVWHDRAVFHFLTEPADRKCYRRALDAGLSPGGLLVIATFALGGPERCSGLPIVQYDLEKMQAELGSGYELLESTQQRHPTPAGHSQLFQWMAFRRLP